MCRNSAPTTQTTTTSTITANEELETSSKSASNLPGDIGSSLQDPSGFWGGFMDRYTSLFLDKKGFDDEWSWGIRSSNRQTQEFFALSKNNSMGNLIQNGSGSLDSF